MAESSFLRGSNFSNSNQDVKTEPVTYVNEICQMMHGFGDASRPLVESAKIIEDVVSRQMRAIISKASEVAERRNQKFIDVEDFLFLLRKDKIKLHRIMKYLNLKDFKSKMFRMMKDEHLSLQSVEDQSQVGSLYQEFVSSIDNTGNLSDMRNVVDEVKMNRSIRADLMSIKMDDSRYIEYAKARSVSFANRDRHKFSEWISAHDDYAITKQGYFILSYLAFETVAEIVDLALIVREDQMKMKGDSIDRLRFSHINPSTYQPNQAPIAKPITPSEIYEALRRYWSPQMDITGPFHRASTKKPHLKLFAC